MISVMANAMLGTPIKWNKAGEGIRFPVVAWALTPEGVGMMAYHQRWQGITLAAVLNVAESEDELWAIADGWCDAAGCDAYTEEMIQAVSGEPKKAGHRYNPTERSYTDWMLPAEQREDWIGE
jgi:hypothetical protein